MFANSTALCAALGTTIALIGTAATQDGEREKLIVAAAVAAPAIHARATRVLPL